MTRTESLTQQATGDCWRVTVLSESLVRFEWDPDGDWTDGATQVIVERPIEPTPVTINWKGTGVQVITGRLQLDYDGGAPSTSGLSVKARDSYHSVWRFGSELVNPFDAVVARRTNLGGTARTLDTVDGATTVDDGLASRLGIAMLDDSASFLVGPSGELTAPQPGHVDLYVFTHGRDHAQAVRDFYRLTGPPPMIPRYAFGNWWSRFYRYTQPEYEQLMDRFEREHLPFSVAVIDMDWHVTAVDRCYGHGWTGYTWNRELFPDPEGFLRGLHDRGLAVSLNVHPADGIRAFEDCYPAACEVLGRDPGDELPIDFDLTDPDFVRAYFEVVHHPLEDLGVDFWWIDWQQGTTSRTGMDPLWLLNHLHVQDMVQQGKRPLILSRYSGPGSHRFPVGFSGDTIATWASLAFQPWFTATAANIGYGMWSHDIGGHAYGSRDDELSLRWLQFGVLSPINRLHSTMDTFLGKEPWKFRDDVANIMGRFLRWRHQLIPYLYTEWGTGEPLVRPMYHSHGDDEHAYDVDNQYWLGSSIIVAPVTQPIDLESLHAPVKTWLPDGEWTDLLTGLRYTGNRLLTMHRPLDSIPVLAKAGTIIPHAEIGTRACDLPTAFDLWIVLGADGAYELIEDDGLLTPQSVSTHITWDDASGVLSVSAAHGGIVDALPEHRRWRVKFLGGLVDGQGTREPDTGAILVDLGDAPTSEPFVWQPQNTLRPGHNEVRRRVEEFIEKSQTAAANKSAVAGVVAAGTDALTTITALREYLVRGAEYGLVTPLPPSLIDPVTEILVALSMPSEY